MDAVFGAAFAEAKISQNYFARYLLRAMEQQHNKVVEPEFVPSDDENSINLEHVLPENPGASWPGVDADAAAALLRRIGNLVLLQASKNTLIGNSSFDAKKPILKSSSFVLTQQVADNDAWGSAEISSRQAVLARLAVRTWPVAL